MSGLLFLSTDDFHIVKDTKGDVMCNNIPGFSLLLFYSTHCNHCVKLIPIFKQLPGSVGGCNFGMLNVSQNKQCVIMSRQTIAPINVVPYIVLFVDGKPYMRYKGPHEHKEIARFVIEVSQNIQSSNEQRRMTPVKPQSLPTDNPVQQPKIEKMKNGEKIPAYSTGRPLCGGSDNNVCYLTFSNAYANEQN